MAERAITAVVEARRVADYLDDLGEHKRANDVRRVCRSNDSYRGTMQVLYRDNIALREQMKLPGRPYPKPRPERASVRADLLEHASYLIGDRDPKLAELFRRMSVEAAA